MAKNKSTKNTSVVEEKESIVETPVAKKSVSCYLVSTAKYASLVKYGNQYISVPPGARKLKVADASLLGALPPNVRKVIKGE